MMPSTEIHCLSVRPVNPTSLKACAPSVGPGRRSEACESEEASYHAPALGFSVSALTLTVIAQPALTFFHNSVVAVAVDALGDVA